MNVNDLFNLSLIDRSAKTALLYGESSFSFNDLDVRSTQVVHFLQSQGYTKGDRLGIYLENCVEFIDFYLACLRLGVIVVPINILYRDREISHIVNDARPKAILSKDKIDGVDTILIAQFDQLPSMAGSAIPALPNINGDDPAAVIYTSGTTGASKGAVLTHHNFMANTMNLNTCWKITEQDRLLLGLPLFHVHGLANGLHCSITAGAIIKLLPKFEHQKLPSEFESFNPTLFYGVPTVYVRMLEQPEATARKMGQNVRLFVSGSAPLPPQVMDDFKTLYGHTILERYGMTETLMNISNPYVGERRPGTVGFPLPGLSAKIVKPDGSLALADEEGELYLKGPNVFTQYWNREEATKAAFDEEGYFKTGDMATVSNDGYYTLRGRKSDLIISGGFNIYPREIEEFLLEQNEISEAAVVGIPDKIRGELPVAFVVPNGQLDIQLLEEKCRKALASFKVPKKFVVKDSLPRTALGKVQKHVLKTELS